MIVYAVGDAATGNADSAKLASYIASQNPDHFLWLGDVYESGTASEFAVNYKPSWGQLDHCVHAIPGNHDWPNFSTGFAPYFSQPQYHSFSDQGWTFVMLNSEGDIQVQVDWIKTLNLAGRKNIACWHRPRYCSGSHGDAADTDPLWQILAPYCPIVIGGHAHNMQHFKPIQNCTQLVSGAGGRGLYAEIPNDPALVWGNASGYGVVRLTLTDTCLVTWVDENGITLYEQAVT